MTGSPGRVEDQKSFPGVWIHLSLRCPPPLRCGRCMGAERGKDQRITSFSELLRANSLADRCLESCCTRAVLWWLSRERNEAPFERTIQTVRSGAFSAKASDDESCTFDSARLIRQDVPSLFPLCVDPCEAMCNHIMSVSGNNRVARHDIRFCSARDVSGLPKSQWSSKQAHLNLGWCCKREIA